MLHQISRSLSRVAGLYAHTQGPWANRNSRSNLVVRFVPNTAFPHLLHSRVRVPVLIPGLLCVRNFPFVRWPGPVGTTTVLIDTPTWYSPRKVEGIHQTH